MSEHITHLAVCDDVFRLATYHPGIHERFKTLMVEQIEHAHMGSITRHADKWSADIIAYARDERKNSENERDPFATQKLAFVLGSLTHRSADRHMKPIIRCWGDGPERKESTIYMDIHSFREVFCSGRGKDAMPFSEDTFAMPKHEAETRFAQYFKDVFRRTLIHMHTFKPDDDNIHTWFENFFRGLQDFKMDLNTYARAAAEWDPAKVKAYLQDKHFYQRDDATIALARRIQNGDPVGDGEVAEAMAAISEANSWYARTLKRALEYLLAATELYDGKISIDDAKQRFDIGVPEMSLADHHTAQ